MGEPRRQTGPRLVQRAAGNVDRHVGLQRVERLEEDFGLAARPGAELDKDRASRRLGRDLARTGAQDRSFGPGRIIFRKVGDLLEQGAATRIVEKLTWQRLRRAGEARQRGICERGLAVVCRREIVMIVGHDRSLASRRPANCQRWWG